MLTAIVSRLELRHEIRNPINNRPVTAVLSARPSAFRAASKSPTTVPAARTILCADLKSHASHLSCGRAGKGLNIQAGFELNRPLLNEHNSQPREECHEFYARACGVDFRRVHFDKRRFGADLSRS